MAFNYGKTIGQDFHRGFPGTPSRSIDDIIVSFPLQAQNVTIPFGATVVLDTNKEGVIPFGEGSVAADFIGFALRGTKAGQSTGEDPAYGKGDEVDVQTRGRLTVLVTGSASPARGGKVYALPGGTVTADSTASGAVALPGVIFAGNGKDMNGVAEITMLDRKY